MGKIKAVFFDIDGTLVSFKTHRIPPSTLDAVAALRSRGIKVYIATGRPVPFIDNLGELEYGMITVTGAHCFTSGGEVIYHQSVSAESVGRVVGHLTHGADAYPVIFVCSDEMFITELNEDVDAVARLLDIKMPPVRPASYACGKDVLQLISFFKADRTAFHVCVDARLHFHALASFLHGCHCRGSGQECRHRQSVGIRGAFVGRSHGVWRWGE